VAMKIHGRIQAGLPTKSRQKGVGTLALDDLGNHFPGNRFDISSVGHLRVGHDGRRVGVDQNDNVALLTESLARLGAAVIEFTSLAEEDGPEPNEENLAKVGFLWHGDY